MSSKEEMFLSRKSDQLGFGGVGLGLVGTGLGAAGLGVALHARSKANDAYDLASADTKSVTGGEGISATTVAGNVNVAMKNPSAISTAYELSTTSGKLTVNGKDGVELQYDGTNILSVASASEISLKSNESVTISHSANGSGDDLIISQTGAQDASLHLQSAGNGTDAIKVEATGGGVDIDANSAVTINGADDSNFTVTGTAKSLTLSAVGGGAQTVTVSSAGTGADAIGINATGTGGGVDIDANSAVTIDGADDSNFTVTGTAKSLTLSAVGGGAQTVTVSSAGTGADAIGLTASAGGVEITTASGVAGILQLNPGTGGLITKRVVQTIADSANDATAAQYVAGFINCTGGYTDTWTLPTGPVLADAMPSDTVTIGDSFICYVINGSGGAITYEAGSSGSPLSAVGNSTLDQKNASMAKLEFIFTVATAGSEEYHALLHADNA